MRFFDEDVRQFEWTLAIAGPASVLYIGSFIVIRSESALPSEESRSGYERDELLGGNYRPLIIRRSNG